MGGVSKKEFNQIGSFLGFAVLSIFYIYFFIQLSFDEEYSSIYGILIIWILSKFAAYFEFKRNQQQYGIGFFIVPSIFQAEWIFTSRNENDTYKKLILQCILTLHPINLCIYYLISDTSRSIDHGYYIALIFINYIMIGISNFAATEEFNYRQYYDLGYYIFPSICRHFCFWYLFMQSFTYNWIIGVCIVGFQIFMYIIDFFFFKVDEQTQIPNSLRDDKFYNFILYAFQMNCYYFIIFSSCNENVLLKSWKQILSQCVQIANVIVLTAFKIMYYPFIIETDKAFYSFLAISSLQVLFLILNIYHKLTKKNKYELITKWVDGQCQIENEAFNYLDDRFIIRYNINIEIDETCLQDQYLDSFNKGICKTLYSLLNKIKRSGKNHRQIIIQNKNEEFSIIIKHQTNLYSRFRQIIHFKDEFFLSKNAQSIFQRVEVILKEVNTECHINPDFIYEFIEFLIFSQTFNQIHIMCFNKNNQQLLRIEIVENLRKLIRAYHFQTLAFHKILSGILTLNPNLVLYDLAEL